MKNLLFAIIAVILFACNSEKKGTNNEISEQKTEKVDFGKAMTVEQLIEVAANSIDKEVYLKGTVDHVCARSGKRCILIDNSGEFSIRVEASGNINGFNRELSGMEIAVKGILKEERLTSELIDEKETKIKEEQIENEKERERCAARLSNIKKMQKWMQTNNKDYYPVYFVEGTDYEVKK